jgi:hypothetical protein
VILSHQHRFIFIKTYKTASTSIEVFLSQHCGDDDVVTPIAPPVPPHRPRHWQGRFSPWPELVALPRFRLRDTLRAFYQCARGIKYYNHMAAYVLRARIQDEQWRHYYKFCVERNPWDKTLSHFHYLRETKGDGGLTLDSYLAQGRYPLNYPLYLDPAAGNGLLVDRVIRYEHLHADLAEVMDRLGIPFDGSLAIRAKGQLRRDRRPYQEVYTEEQRAVVEKAFDREIRLHGYRF